MDLNKNIGSCNARKKKEKKKKYIYPLRDLCVAEPWWKDISIKSSCNKMSFHSSCKVFYCIRSASSFKFGSVGSIKGNWWYYCLWGPILVRTGCDNVRPISGLTRLSQIYHSSMGFSLLIANSCLFHWILFLEINSRSIRFCPSELTLHQ